MEITHHFGGNTYAKGANSMGQGQGYGTSTATQPGGWSNPWVSALGGAQVGKSLWGGGMANSLGFGTSGNYYGGTSSNPSAPNYENSYDLSSSGWGRS